MKMNHVELLKVRCLCSSDTPTSPFVYKEDSGRHSNDSDYLQYNKTRQSCSSLIVATPAQKFQGPAGGS